MELGRVKTEYYKSESPLHSARSSARGRRQKTVGFKEEVSVDDDSPSCQLSNVAGLTKKQTTTTTESKEPIRKKPGPSDSAVNL